MPRRRAVPISEPAENEAPEAPPLSKIMAPDDFFRATAAYPKNAALTYRIYRLWPKIDRKLVDPEAKKWIDQQSSLDLAYLKKTWGEGDYQIYFNDANKPWNAQQIAQTTLEIRDPEYPPVLDQAELVIGHKANQSYIEGLKMRGQWHRDKEGRPLEAPKDNPADVVREALNFGREIVGNSRPAEQPAGAKEAIDVLTTAYKTAVQHLGSDKQSANSNEFLVLMMNHQHEILMETLKARRADAAPQSVEDDLAKMERLVSLADKIRGNGGGESGFSWSSLLTSLPALLGALPQITQLVALANAQQQARPMPAPVPMPAAAPAVTPDVPMPAIPGGDVNILRIAELGKAALDAFKLGLSGDEFAELLVRRHGESAYNDLAIFDAPTIMQALQSFPQAWAEIQGRQVEVEKFIGDFLEWGKEPAEPPAPEK